MAGFCFMRTTIRSNTRLRVGLRDGFRCRYCGRRVWPWNSPRPEIDHILPVARGGRNWRNLAWACHPCNRRKAVDLWRPRPLTWWQVVLSVVLLVLLMDWPRLEDL